MGSEEVIDLYELLDQKGIEIWNDWVVDERRFWAGST